MHSDLDRLVDLTGRVAIVTGGSRGLGRAMAIGLAKAGASVVVASRKVDACQEVVDEIVSLGGRATAIPVRMQEHEDIEALVATAVARLGRLDIVVNNAATVLDRSLEAMTPEAFNGAFSTNLLGPLLLTKAAAPHLAEHGVGAILNISSIAAVRATPARYLYPAVKSALLQHTRSLAVHLAPQSIRVNAIMPGTFRTDMVEKAYTEDQLAETAGHTPLGRVAEPTELVGPALFLVSDMSSYVTGAVLTVDGGQTLVA